MTCGRFILVVLLPAIFSLECGFDYDWAENFIHKQGKPSANGKKYKKEISGSFYDACTKGNITLLQTLSKSKCSRPWVLTAVDPSKNVNFACLVTSNSNTVRRYFCALVEKSHGAYGVINVTEQRRILHNHTHCQPVGKQESNTSKGNHGLDDVGIEGLVTFCTDEWSCFFLINPNAELLAVVGILGAFSLLVISFGFL